MKYSISAIYKRTRNYFAKLLVQLGYSPQLNTKDRVLLEKTILPYFIKQVSVKDVLFIGCEWYTKRYENLFTHCNYCTLDKDPSMRLYGAKNHIIDELQNLPQYFPENSIDLIICNGVLGWGLNDKTDIENAFFNCYYCLKTKGIFILGWNDIEGRRPITLNDSETLKKFSLYTMPGMHSHRIYTHSRNSHVYDFYIKR